MRNVLSVAVFAGLVVALLAGAAEAAPQYTLTKLGEVGWPASDAKGINNNGMIVGTYQPNYSTISSFYYDGTMHDIGGPSASTPLAPRAVNNSGVIAGNVGEGADTHATTWDGATWTDLGTIGGTNSQAAAINAGGRVVGKSWDTSTNDHAFLYDGAINDLGTMGGD